MIYLRYRDEPGLQRFEDGFGASSCCREHALKFEIPSFAVALARFDEPMGPTA